MDSGIIKFKRENESVKKILVTKILVKFYVNKSVIKKFTLRGEFFNYLIFIRRLNRTIVTVRPAVASTPPTIRRIETVLSGSVLVTL